MPSLLEQLEDSCIGLSSTKIFERKKCLEHVLALIEKPELITLLNESDNDKVNWNNLVGNIHLHLIKEAEKLQDDERKKKNNPFYRQNGHNLLLNVIHKANAGAIRLNITSLLQYVLQCFTTTSLKKYFLDTYILILKDILSDVRCHGEIEKQEWMNLLNILQSFIKDNKNDNTKVIECLEVLLKWGPLHKLSLVELRNEFNFMTRLCLSLTKSSPKAQQEAVLKMLLEFCNQHCKDCCMDCCKLGEAVFRNLRSLYEVRANENSVKYLLLEFFLLQVKLHHPKGSPEGSPAAYAFSWLEWNKQLHTIHHIIQEEINHSLISNFRNSLFCCNNLKQLNSTFTSLIVNVCKQVFSSANENMLELTLLSLNVSPPIAKRPKTEFGMAALISDIQESKSWQWINVMTELLRSYPELIIVEDFLRLLQILCSLQSECKDSDVLYHIYECLSVLIDVEKCLDITAEKPEFHRIWCVIWDSAVRSAGLNQNVDVTHKLLQKLISQRKMENLNQLFEAYASGVLVVTRQSLITLCISSSVFSIPENDKSIRRKLLNWILNIDTENAPNTEIYSETITSEVLVLLCLKQWPRYISQKDEIKQKVCESFDVESVYLLNAFEQDLILAGTDGSLEKSNLKSYVVNAEMQDALLELLKNITLLFTNYSEEQIFVKNLLNIIILVNNVLSFLMTYKVITNENRLNELVDELHFKDMFLNVQKILLTYLNNANSNDFISLLKNVNILLSADICSDISFKIRSYIQTELLEKLYDIIYQDDDLLDVKSDNSYCCLLCMEFLCNLSCVKNAEEISDFQRFILMKTSEPNFNVENYTHYKMAMLLMSSFNNYKPGTISSEILLNVLSCLKEICQVYYAQYKEVLEILLTLHDLCVHISLTKGDDVKEQANILIQTFYNLKSNYGPNVSVVLIKCMGQICKMDPAGTWSKWEDKNVAVLIAEFLSSDYEEIRLSAIKQLMFLFKLNSHDNAAIYRTQGQVFDCVNIKSREVFKVEMVQSAMEQRRIDETVTRTATVLHTYGALMTVNSMWRQKALFAVIELVYEKKLDKGLLLKLLNIVVRNLKIKNVETYLNEHVDYLLQQWHRNNHPLSEFPHEFFDCDSEALFYDKYLNIVIPIFVQSQDLTKIDNIAQNKGKSISEIIELAFPRIIATCFLTKSSEDNTYGTLQKLLTKDINELILNKIDYVLINMIQSVFDKDEFKKQFDIQYDVVHSESKHFSLAEFKNAMILFEGKLSLTTSIINHCIITFPNKIQNIILDLTVKIHKSSGLEDKLEAMHHYSLFIDLVIPFLFQENKIKIFVLRHVLFSLLNLIIISDEMTVNIAACKYFKQFCENILPQCSKTMEKYFFVVVSKLMSSATREDEIGRECVDLLNFLIVENLECFRASIESLDPFPQCETFNKINTIWMKLRQRTLKDEIKHFLTAGNLMGNMGHRLEALRYLKNQLATKKNELKILYDSLQNVRGFYEDCKDSILHQLISMLVQLTSSAEINVRLEATRCLGELGPSDLTTIILQPQSVPEDDQSHPLQFTTTFVMQKLSEYAVDADVEVIQVASQTLYEVLDTKEGKDFIEINKRSEEIDTAFLHPFLSKRKIRSDSIIQIDWAVFRAKIDDELWCPVTDHDVWIKNLVSSLLECFTSKSYLNKLIPMCNVKISFCEQLFPYILYLIVYHANEKYINIISKCVDSFFSKVWKLSLDKNQSNTVQKSSVQCMLNSIHFLRLQTSVNNQNIQHLSINYLKVAQAAYFCSTYFATLLYVELWCQTAITALRNSGKKFNTSSTMLDVICDNENKEICEVLQTILRQTYIALSDLDALNGCGYMHLLNTDTRVDHYKELGQWEQVVLHYDIQAAHGSTEYFPELTNALKKCQLYQLALDYNQSKGETDYECFWRLNQFTHNNNNKQTEQQYEQSKYSALKSLCENDYDTFTESITSARTSVIEFLKNADLEGTKSLYDSFAQLQCVQELEDLYSAKENQNFHDVFEKWTQQDLITKNDFKYLEPIKAQRISMLNGLLKVGYGETKKALVDFYLDLSDLAKAECDFKVAKRAMENLSLLPDLSEEYKAYKMFEEAQIYWSTNVKPFGKCIINRLLKEKKDDLRLYFNCLKLYGKWLIETRSENPDTILCTYLFKALKVMKDIDKTPEDYENVFDTYAVIASFVDAEYQRILNYVKSSEFERKVQNMDKSRKTAEKIESQCGFRPNEDERRAIIIHKRQSTIDENEINSTRKEKDTYLILAAKYYLLNLQYSDSNNMRIFRIISLLLENRSNSDLLKVFKEYLPKIPSYKYISILPQLVPHLSSNSEEEFGKQIYLIIERCSKDHPHHTLSILLALANSNKDDKYCSVVATTESNEPRVLGAQKLIENLKQQEPSLRKLISGMENLSEALLELAYLEREKCRQRSNKEDFAIPDRVKIMRLKNLSHVLLPTYTLAVNKGCDYSNIVGIHSFGTDFVYVGGINAPKRITCRGTDGVVRSQLVKGKDDLRQDAVMQQVFTIMNELLRSNKQTSKLLIRTYKVVPLSKRSGLIEWVENSMTIGEYLVGAHRKYNRRDLDPDKCRVALREVQKSSNDVKLERFKEVCNNFRPIMHKFFETQFPQPVIWYERRRAYIQSVATSSMCGYILGLGDRHVLNILLDKTTAEVIHIDFGIAFEQGRVLPTPETVPFRLTRDIEDGMGVSGIEGVFRRVCEKTMEVLRQNSETILTILEVLLYDPLYAWTITPAEAYSKQLTGEDNDGINFSEEEKVPVNITAERALLKLRQKLQGTEEGRISSVESQVEKLLQEARDFTNLSRLYFGWQAYL